MENVRPTNQEDIKQLMQNNQYRTIEQDVLYALPKRLNRSNKGTYGKVLCIAGRRNMAGAAYLCAWAAYRTGAGLVRILTPEVNRVILQTLLPEAVLTTFDPEVMDWKCIRDAFDWADTAAVGPGLGREPWALALTRAAMTEFIKPVVLDADGLNHLSEHRELLTKREGALILTPHPGEFARLTGQKVQDIIADIPGQARRFAEEHQCICVLKDAPSAVGSLSGDCYVNTTGNNGMSTGGSGDVLTGIIAGLLAQKSLPLQAALLGVWLHGRAGDLAVKREGPYGMMARHLLEYLPEAMKERQEEE